MWEREKEKGGGPWENQSKFIKPFLQVWFDLQFDLVIVSFLMTMIPDDPSFDSYGPSLSTSEFVKNDKKKSKYIETREIRALSLFN